MEPAQSTQSDEIKGKMDDSGQFFVEYPRARLSLIVEFCSQHLLITALLDSTYLIDKSNKLIRIVLHRVYRNDSARANQNKKG